MNKPKGILLLLIMTLTSLLSTTASAAEEKFDAGQFIFGHIRNAYGWHVTTVGGREVTIPLPVIVRSQDKGWFVFSSEHLMETGEYTPTEGVTFKISDSSTQKGRLVEMVKGEEVRPWDLSITKNVLEILIAAIIVVWVMLALANHYRKTPMKAPHGFLGAIEVLVNFVINEIIKPCIGPDYKRYTPYLITVFFFILTNNLLGMIPIFPGGANVTGNLAVTGVLALISFVMINVFATKDYWKDIFFVPAAPMWLKLPIPVMPLLEFIGIFTKPLALMIRLFANILAGHIIELVFMVLIFIFGAMSHVAGAGVGVFSVAFAFFMQTLEVLLVLLQAYVFTLLSAVFIGLSKVEPEKE